MVSQKYHTPLCGNNCKIEHHDLVTVLCLDSSQKSDEIPDLLKECIGSYQNWDHNGEVPDPLEDLRCPLIYLASSFGKAALVRALLQDNFDARAVNFNGETALHGATHYIYRTGALKNRGFKVASTLGPIKNRMKAFEQILISLTEKDPKLMFVQDNNGNTAFHAVADNIWNDRSNDPQGKTANFYQFCLKSMINRALALEEGGKLTREETLEALNAENGEGDTIFHILARDYAFGFKSMKQVLDKLFDGQAPSKINKEKETVAKIALRRNHKRAIQVFPDFLKQSDSSILVSSDDSETSVSDSPSPGTSGESKEISTLTGTTAHQEIPLIVISDQDMPQVPHLIEAEENSSSEVIANSEETTDGFTEQEQDTVPLANPGTHDLLTVSIDSTLGKVSRVEVPSFLSLSHKSNVVSVSSFDRLISTPVNAEVMYVTETITTSKCNNSAEKGEQDYATCKHIEKLDTADERTANDQSDPTAPFSTTPFCDSYSGSPSNSQQGSIGGEPPNEERMAINSEESASRKSDEEGQTVAENIADVSGKISDDVQENSFENEASEDNIVESRGAHVPMADVVDLDAPTSRKDGHEPSGHKTSFDVPQANQTQRGNSGDYPTQEMAVCGTIPSDLFDPPLNQSTQTGEYTQQYAAYYMIDTPSPASQNHSNVSYDKTQAQETKSLTSLASASTESIHSDSLESLDVSQRGSDDRSTILKCITDNSFLEFLITEGLELDSSSKKDVVHVVMTQYSNKLNDMESTIPKLAAQIRRTETTIDQQKEKVAQLQKELEYVKSEIVKNKNALEGFTNEKQELSKRRKALKRKVTRCEQTMKQLLGNSKKSRFD